MPLALYRNDGMKVGKRSIADVSVVESILSGLEEGVRDWIEDDDRSDAIDEIAIDAIDRGNRAAALNRF